MSFIHGLEATGITILGSTPALISMINTRRLQREQAKRRETYEYILAHIDHWRDQRKHPVKLPLRSHLRSREKPNEPTWENKLTAKVQMWASGDVKPLFATFKVQPSGPAAERLTQQILAEQSNSKFLAHEIWHALIRSAALIAVAALVAYISFYTLTGHRTHEYQAPWRGKHNVIAAGSRHSLKANPISNGYSKPPQPKESPIKRPRPPSPEPRENVTPPTPQAQGPAATPTPMNTCSGCNISVTSSPSPTMNALQQVIGSILNIPASLISSLAHLLDPAIPSAYSSTQQPSPNPTRQVQNELGIP